MLLSATRHARVTAVPALLLVLLMVSGCSQHQTTTGAVTPVVPGPPAAVPFDGHVTIYGIATTKQEDTADANGLVSTQITVNPAAKDPAREALDALAAAKNSPLPSGTKIQSVSIDQSSGLATVDFSREFKDNFPGGDTREAQVLDSVLETLGQFPNVQNVQFLVNGAKIDSLGGTQDLSTPLPVIKDSKVAAAGN